MLTRYILFWLPMIVIAFMNAAIRQLVLSKYFSEMRSHQLSTVPLTIFCAFYVFLVFRFLHIQSSKQALLAGITWVILTVIFESSLGRVTKKSWADILADYNIMNGKLWPVFLFFLLFLPYVYYFFKM